MNKSIKKEINSTLMVIAALVAILVINWLYVQFYTAPCKDFRTFPLIVAHEPPRCVYQK